MNTSLMVGDIVTLKSDSPLLTVVRVGALIECWWFDKNKLKKHTFDPSNLIRVK